MGGEVHEADCEKDLIDDDYSDVLDEMINMWNYKPVFNDDGVWHDTPFSAGDKLIEKIERNGIAVTVRQWNGQNDFSVEFGNEWGTRGTFLEIVQDVAEGLRSLENAGK